ncbi:transposase [Draconibacterium mangrovi]|uniref:transposase n=1 Tax=Draconibacterium mangrovi TaxID=2697469 RepID=UPI0013D355B4|nr:transposase [Draconibacterium mangrovi]
MENFIETVGIDVSKDKIDAAIYTNQNTICVSNNRFGFKRLIDWVISTTKLSQFQILYVLEYTGYYSISICRFFDQNEINYSIVPGLEIKRSLGLVRGKDDKIDAKRIALYGYRRIKELIPSRLPSLEIIKLKKLLSLRHLFAKHLAAYRSSKKVCEILIEEFNLNNLTPIYKKSIEYTDAIKTKIDKEMLLIITKNKYLFNLFNLITSIKGIGTVTAIYFIAFTEAFNAFDNPRKFACYCGTAPFPRRSGSASQSKDRVSTLANIRIKAHLGNCVATAIQYNKELKAYYDRRLAEGKHPSIIKNNIKNKLIATVFAVVKRGTPYIETYGIPEYSAHKDSEHKIEVQKIA